MKAPAKWLWAGAAAALVLATGAYLARRAVTETEFGVVLLSRGPLMPSGRLVENLRSAGGGVVRDSLAALRDRADPAGVQAAIPLLKSPDPYVWFNAALYLGAVRRQEAVPYLIKGLRHPAWRAHAECAAHLAVLTGQNFGTDFEKWRDWWQKNNPGAAFDFESDLGR